MGDKKIQASKNLNNTGKTSEKANKNIFNKVTSTLSADASSMKRYAENVASNVGSWDNIKSSSFDFMDDMAGNTNWAPNKINVTGRMAGYGLVMAAGLDFVNPFGFGWND